MPQRPNVRKLTDEQVKEAARLYKTGLSFAKVSEQFGVDATTMNKELQKAGERIG